MTNHSPTSSRGELRQVQPRIVALIDCSRRVRILSYAKMEFGLIPSEHWNQPDWIDEEKATAAREDMMSQNIIYAGMCIENRGWT
jgi:hypothetical protein